MIPMHTAQSQVPFVDLAAQYAAIAEEIDAAVSKTIREADFILGRAVRLFEEEFARFCEAQFATGVDSGTSALELALRAYDIGPGDEVITAPNSFIASALAISHAGATPVFADIDADSYTIDVAALEMAITPRTYGQQAKYHHMFRGYNRRLDTLQEAVLRVKLRYLEKWNAARRQHAGRYRFLFEKSRIVTPNEALYAESVWLLYVVRVSHRDTFKDYLSSRGIHCGIHYPVPVHLQPAYHDLGHKRGDFPVTEDYAQRIISLPMYAELTPELIARVAEAAVEFVDGTRSSVVGTMAPEPPRATTTLP